MQDQDNLSPLRAFFRQKWVRIILISDAVLIVGLIIVLIVFSFRNAVINFNITPLDAEISVNGKSGYENGSYSFFPGTYEIVISHKDLDSKTFTVNVSPYYYVTISAFLSDNGNFDFYEQKANFRSFEKLREIASAGDNQTIDHDTSAENFIANLEYIMSIRELLPIKGYVYADPTANASTAGFAIRYGEEGCEMIACLLVNYYGSNYKEAVIEEIEKVGYDPADYQILYERYNY